MHAWHAATYLNVLSFQDEATGLPSHRRHKLERVFKIIDKVMYRLCCGATDCNSSDITWVYDVLADLYNQQSSKAVDWIVSNDTHTPLVSFMIGM